VNSVLVYIILRRRVPTLCMYDTGEAFAQGTAAAANTIYKNIGTGIDSVQSGINDVNE